MADAQLLTSPVAYEEVVPGVLSRVGEEEIRVRFELADVAVLDVDECLVAGFTQVNLARETARLLACTALLHPGRLGPLFRLVRAGVLLSWLRGAPIPAPMKNARMQELFTDACRGVPRTVMERALGSAWRGLRPGAALCVRYLAERVPTGIVSLGLDIVLDRFPGVVRKETGKEVLLHFAAANRVLWERDRFAGLARPIRSGAPDKLSLFEGAVSGMHVAAPLVIGHGADEERLCELADSMGGLSVGMAPAEADRRLFHVVVPDGGWDTLLRFMLSCRKEDTGSVN
ncbi:MAG: hypothetical protein KA419_17945 [Acidobacteria bacterium]|nr:hypothetical protein [Acidobacteriota bacterium]